MGYFISIAKKKVLENILKQKYKNTLEKVQNHAYLISAESVVRIQMFANMYILFMLNCVDICTLSDGRHSCILLISYITN